MANVTRILERIETGDPQATEELLPVVYHELRQLAAQQLQGERAGHTLNPTALVHEAYLRLVAPGDTPTTPKALFCAASVPTTWVPWPQPSLSHPAG